MFKFFIPLFILYICILLIGFTRDHIDFKTFIYIRWPLILRYTFFTLIIIMADDFIRIYQFVMMLSMLILMCFRLGLDVPYISEFIIILDSKYYIIQKNRVKLLGNIISKGLSMCIYILLGIGLLLRILKRYFPYVLNFNENIKIIIFILVIIILLLMFLSTFISTYITIKLLFYEKKDIGDIGDYVLIIGSWIWSVVFTSLFLFGWGLNFFIAVFYYLITIIWFIGFLIWWIDLFKDEEEKK